MWQRIAVMSSTLERSPGYLLASCLVLTVLVVVALLFFEAFGQDAAGVVYQDF